MVLPILFGIYAIPVLIAELGLAKFGVLSLLWAISSYFGLFDFGLGRAVTQRLMLALSEKQTELLGVIIGTSSALLIALGLMAGIGMASNATFLAQQISTPLIQPEVENSIFWMALSMPAILLTTGYRGILEAAGQFGIINLIRVPMGIYTYMAPVVGVWLGYSSLGDIALILAIGRFAALIVHGFFGLRAFHNIRGHGSFHLEMAKALLKFGGWLSVSNLVSPLMSYIDRFLLATIISTTAVSYYVTPQELVLRIGIIPAAIAAVIFPALAATRDTNNLKANLVQYSLAIGAVMLPIALLFIIFAHLIIELWITKEFADTAAPVLQILAVSAFFSGLAQVPFSLLQSQARADITAKLHLIELPLYVGLLYLLTDLYGIKGAASAWAIRIGFDMIALHFLSMRLIKHGSGVNLARR
tara:strand:+ start:620 stop:1867 length:1248 start_codon:yes stop_codon:yes gene_type:complete